MVINPSKFAILSMALLVSGCSTFSGNGAVPSAANQSVTTAGSIDAILDSAPTVSGRMLFQKLHVPAAAGTPPILISFLANGPNQAGVPCIDCVYGASTGDNVGLTGPSNYVAANFVWQYGISFEDISYKGKCTLAWAITDGKKTIDSFSAKLDLKAAGGFVLYAVARPRPNYSGPATDTGKVTCGKTKQSLQVGMQFQ